MNPARWNKLVALAQTVIDKVQDELPAEIQSEARDVPVLFHEFCEDDPEIMGWYGNFTAGEISDANGPIILYLITIEEFCADEGEDFRDEVRITYLHELGHHFGWDEGDLEARGLA